MIAQLGYVAADMSRRDAGTQQALAQFVKS
jgi:hypothetical protein